MMRTLLLLSILLFTREVTCQGQRTYMYRVSIWRAAPGHLLDLIGALQGRIQTVQNQEEMKPVIIRHSQGDHWDLMTVEYIESTANYFSKPDSPLNPPFDDPVYDWVSFNEELFANGPPADVVGSVFSTSNYFHVEMFKSLPGKRRELVREREMENVYLTKLDRPQNLIFTKVSGAHWDVFTIGGYRDIQHFAESGSIPNEEEEKAAIEAGFEGVRFISPYLRSLIASHNDTLANKVQ